jgi:hypothetical protein
MLLIILLIIVIAVIYLLPKHKRSKKKPIPESVNTLVVDVKPVIDKKSNKPTIDNPVKLMFEKEDIQYYMDRYNLNETNIVEPIITRTPKNTDLDTLLLNSYYNEIFENNRYDHYHNLFNDMIADDLRNYEHERDTQAQIPILDRILVPEANSQNVHDTGVNKYIRDIYRDRQPVYNDNIVNEIKRYLMGNDISDEKRNDIEFVLDKIQKRNGKVSNIDRNELDVLATVWNEAKSNDNIRDMLLTQIADTKKEDHDDIVCVTGFVNRISTALVVETPEKFPRTNNMLNAEMLQTASVIRNGLEKNLQYTNSDEATQTSMFKEEFYKKVETDYAGILDKKEIDDMIKPWIDHV